MAKPQDCHFLTDHYLKNYFKTYGRKPTVNRNKARWGFDSVLYDMTVPEAADLVEYYLTTSSSSKHSLEWFFNNYDKLIEKRDEYLKDEADRRKLREASRRRMEEMKIADSRSEDVSSSL